MEPSWLQIILGTLTLMCSLYLIIAKTPVVSAIMLMSTLFLTGALYFSQGFFFIGSVQILIYAGAISVLFIFIVMLLDQKPISVNIPGRKTTLGLGILAAVLMFAALAPAVLPLLGGSPSLPADAALTAQSADGAAPVIASGVQAASAKGISLLFLSKYMIPFQATGLLILAAVMGVAVLGKHSSSQDGY